MSQLATAPQSLVALFDRHVADQPCACGRAQWCPSCGTWHPAVTDPEVLDALAGNAARSGGRRVIRKSLDD